MITTWTYKRFVTWRHAQTVMPYGSANIHIMAAQCTTTKRCKHNLIKIHINEIHHLNNFLKICFFHYRATNWTDVIHIPLCSLLILEQVSILQRCIFIVYVNISYIEGRVGEYISQTLAAQNTNKKPGICEWDMTQHLTTSEIFWNYLRK